MHKMLLILCTMRHERKFVVYCHEKSIVLDINAVKKKRLRHKVSQCNKLYVIYNKINPEM